MDAEEDEEGEEEGEGEEEEEKEEDEQEEGGSIRRPQQAEPSGKRSYLQSIDSLCKWFGSNVGDSVVINHPPKRQIPTDIVELLHPNNIRFHVAAGIDPYFVEETLNLFWHNFGKSRMLLRFERGISGARKGHLPTWIGTNDLQWFGVMTMLLNAPCIEVSRFIVWSHLQDHVLSLSPVAEPHVVLPLSEDEALLGNIVQVHRGPYASQTGIIEWISPNGKVWMFNCRKGKGKEDSERDPTPSQSMVAMNASDLHIERAPSTLTLSKDKGCNIAVGDTVEVARGQWRHSQGIVKAVDLIKASLDFMHLEDGIQISIPIMFSHKVKEHFDYGLSKFLQHCLKSLHNQSFITPVVPCNVTPPPSPGLSNAGPLDAWSITPDNIIRTQTPNYGEVPWLFQSEFCDFKSFHLGFNISVGFTQVSLGKCIVQTAQPFNTSQSLLGTLHQPTPPAKINYAWYLRDLKQEDLYI
ncbi:hypothetical protein EDD16DRAFT_1525194 [Pisolithus croceorrhizus]|nr:hypothetical protein EDD16DRAFT_1525194 [Pisolithus croceorrhizus]